MTDKKVPLSDEDLDQVTGGKRIQTMYIRSKIDSNYLLKEAIDYPIPYRMHEGDNPSKAFAKKLASALGLQSISFSRTEETTAITKDGKPIGYREICNLIDNFK